MIMILDAMPFDVESLLRQGLIFECKEYESHPWRKRNWAFGNFQMAGLLRAQDFVW